MMVAVTLLLVIISALLGVFYQTQRAFRLSVTQVDVLEGGRAFMELVTGELPEITHSYSESQINLYARTAFSFLVQPRPSPLLPRSNVIQDLYFLRQHNDEWIGTGYFVVSALTNADGIGTLYRFERSVANVTSNAQISSLFVAFQNAIVNFPTTNSHRVIDRVVSLKLSPYNLQGQFMTNRVDASLSFTNFVEDLLPAYLDVELGILEPRAFEKYKALGEADAARASAYLSQRVQSVHLFRQRIPIFSEPRPTPVPPTR